MRAVVEHGHALGGDALADAAGERARALAVEVALEAVADRLVQQHAGPARAEDDAHHPGLGRTRLEVGERGVDGGVHVLLDDVVLEVAEAEATAAAAVPGLAPHHAGDRLLGDDRERQAHQRPHVGGDRAVGAGDEDDVVLARQAGHHLDDARVLAAREALDLLEQRHLLRAVERRDRIHRRVEHAARRERRLRADLDAPALPRRRDRSHRARRVEQRRLGDVVGVGERGLLAGDRAHADALVDAEAAALDDAFLEAPAFAPRVLEVEIGVVDAVRRDRRQRARQLAFIEAERLEQAGRGRRRGVRSWVRGRS